MRTSYLVLTLTFISLSISYSQDQSTFQQNELNSMLKSTVRIQTPNTASLGQYGEIPVGLYTGVPDISIPLYEIEYGGIKIPIVLSYHASGIRVNQEASWVGLGWALDAGGMITQNIRDDDNAFGEQCFPDPLTSPSVNNYELKLGDVQSLCNGVPFEPQNILGDVDFDGEPDIYSFNFLGNSGKFFYKRNGDFAFVRKSNIKFEKGDPYNLFNEVNPDYCWTATTISGVKCFFDELEKVEEWVLWDLPKPTRTMYLSNILTPIERSIQFSYLKMVQGKGFPTYSETCRSVSINGSVFSNCAVLEENKKFSDPRIEPVYLQQIDFGIGVIKFIVSDRLDQYGKKLDKIEIYIKNETHPIKTINFNYNTYFIGTSMYGDNMWLFTDPAYSVDRRSKRLKLNSIDLLDATDNVVQTYSFQYDESHQLPYKSSNALDYWNYFNGKDNEGIIPDFSNFSRFNFQVYGIDLNKIGNDNNREPDATYTKTATLTKITYPTGGYTIFDYEPNEYSNPSWLNRYEKFQYVEAGTTEYEKIITMNPIVGIGEKVYLNYVFECGSYSSCNNYTEHYILFQGQDPNNSNISIRINSNTYGKTGTLSQENIPAGRYKISAFKPTGDGYRAYLRITWYEKEEITKATGPGIRIKSIVNYNFDGSETDRKTYIYNKPDGSSLGKLMTTPIFARYTERYIGQCYLYIPDFVKTLTVFSTSVVPMSESASGQPLGYSLVKEIRGINGEGGIITSYFHNNTDNVVYYRSMMPGTPVVYDLANGNLEKRSFLKKVGTSEKRVKEEFYGYETTSNKEWAVITEHGGNNCNDSRLYFHYYPVIYGSSILTSKTESYYDENENINQNITETYSCNNNMLVINASRSILGGDNFSTLTRYTDNYFTSGTPAPLVNESDPRKEDMQIAHALWKLAQDNIFDKPIEIVAKKNNLITDIDLNTYKEYTNNSITHAHPYKILNLETLQPLSSYSNSSISGNYFNYDKSLFGLEYTYELYDEYGNLRQVREPDGTPNCFIWGYNKNFPVAKVIGVPYSAIETVLASDLSSINSNFILSDNSMRTMLDKLRIASSTSGALTTTYTYRPLIGMTSETNERGIKTFYEYDNFGRLKTVKDHNLNVLKQYEYHYKE
jgi:hypothetical protein